MAGAGGGNLGYYDTTSGTYKYYPTSGSMTTPAGGTDAGPAPAPNTPGYLPPGASSKTTPNPTTGGVSTEYSNVSPADAPSSLEGLKNAAASAQLTQSGNIASAARTQEADLAAQAEARRMTEMTGLLGTMGITGANWGAAGTGPGGTGGTGGTGSSVVYPAQAIRSAQDIAFARAKDRVAANARASMTALASEMAARGIASTPGNPSGIQENAAAGVLGAGSGELADVISQQASDEANQQVAGYNTAYQGGIVQRGQDVTARGQDIAARTGMAQSVLGLIRGAAY
jgi:hypothetical protein